VEVNEKGSIGVNDRKRSAFKWIMRGSIFAVSIFMVLLFLLSMDKIHGHEQLPVHRLVKETKKVLHKPDVFDMQRIERSFAQRHIEYLDELFNMRSQAYSLLDQYHQEVDTWGKKHQYYDFYNGAMYKLDYEYNQDQGFGLENDEAVDLSHTMYEYQAATKHIRTNLMHLHAMEADYTDNTLWSRPHASDLRLIRYHHLSGQVIVVSFIEQACRVYQDGKLINAFLITSGRFNDPSPAGMWQISLRKWHTVFRSHVPVGSPNWYPDTPINYAMEYRMGGYYLHDSWWRAYYGRGTNFPHYDPASEEFAGTGSHGCINLSLEDAAWMYANTGYGTAVVTY
jgi:L,D-transpeptidase catalytic domain